MNFRMVYVLVLLLAAAGCGDTTEEDANHGTNNGNNGHNNGNNGHNNGTNNGHGNNGHGNNGHEPEACWEWQRFHMHSAGNAVTVEEGAEGRYTLSNVLFVHGGSWELHFQAAAGAHTDVVTILLCVDGDQPFAECFDDDTTNDEGCDENAVDVSCRGDEASPGDEAHGAHGHFKALLVGTTPDPTAAIDPSAVEIQLQMMDGTPVTGATLSQDPACGAGAAANNGDDHSE